MLLELLAVLCGKNGGEIIDEDAADLDFDVDADGLGKGTEGENSRGELISVFLIASSAETVSHDGGTMLARRWRWRRRASQRGRVVVRGGRRGGVGP